MAASSFQITADEESGELPMCVPLHEFREMYTELVTEFEDRVLKFEKSDPYRPMRPGPNISIKHIGFGMGTCPTTAKTTMDLAELCCWLRNAEIMKDKSGNLAANIPCANFPG